MAAAVQLELQGDSSNFTFDVDGTFFPRLEAEYKTASNPPEIVGLREVWEFRNARLAGGPGAQAAVTAALFVKFLALRSRVATRGAAFPTYARLVIPGGATLHTLGPSTHEGFVIQSLGGEVDPENPAATWRSTATFTLIVSAIQRFADTNGIVGWEQVVDSSYPEGRHRLEWRTRITTAEGTSAAAKAQSYAAINAANLGVTYLYETGDSSGAVDIVKSDADEQNSRTPTVVEAVSRVRHYGTTIGAVTPGASPAEVSYSITSSTNASETTTTTVATATGPGALQFVMSKRPALHTSEVIVDEQARMFASGTWTQVDSAPGAGSPSEKPKHSTAGIKFTVTGGGRFTDYEPTADDLPPVEFRSALTAMTAVAELELETVGGDGTMASLPLLGHPGDPWTLDTNASQESEPTVKDAADSPSRTRWSRSARLVFRCATPPTKPIGEAMFAAPTVPTHLYAR